MTKIENLEIEARGALNTGLRQAFEDELMRDVYTANYPQFNGAIGTVLIASERGY